MISIFPTKNYDLFVYDKENNNSGISVKIEILQEELSAFLRGSLKEKRAFVLMSSDEVKLSENSLNELESKGVIQTSTSFQISRRMKSQIKEEEIEEKLKIFLNQLSKSSIKN